LTCDFAGVFGGNHLTQAVLGRRTAVVAGKVTSIDVGSGEFAEIATSPAGQREDNNYLG
jgi:hypothetical protein